MPYWPMFPDPPRTRSSRPRLASFDYTTPGLYFVTLVVQDRLPLLGTIRDDVVHQSAAGEMVETVWMALPQHYPGVSLDAMMVMPNHVHAIIGLDDPARALSLSDVIQRFKSLTTARYREGVHELGWPPFPGRLWQQSFYDHMIRGEEDLDRIREYILTNPMRWILDGENPEGRGVGRG